MAIEKNALIKAADIVAHNIDLITFSANGLPDKTLGDDSESWYLGQFYFQNNEAGNLYTYAGSVDGDLGQYSIRLYTDVDYTNEIFRWHYDESTPVINTNGWGYSYVQESENPAYRKLYINVPKGTAVYVRMRYSDRVGDSRPNRWYMEFRQAQSDMSIGSPIRVWEEGFAALLPIGTTLVTATLAKTGRLGTG